MINSERCLPHPKCSIAAEKNKSTNEYSGLSASLWAIGMAVLLTTSSGISLAQVGRAETLTSTDNPDSTQASRNVFSENLKPKVKRATAAKVLYNPIQKQDDQAQIPEIEMFVGESRVFPTPGVARIAVGNGAIMSATALDSKEVLIFANGVGTSSLFVWNEDGRYQRVKIHIIPGDTSRYAREIAAFLTGIPNTKASIIGDKVIVEGDNLSDRDLAKIEELAKRYPQIVNFTDKLGWEKMILMDVKVVEFPSNELRDIGIKWSPLGGAVVGGIFQPISRGNDGPYQINLQTGASNPAPISGVGGGTLALPGSLNILSLINVGLNAQLNLLAQNGKATLLAEPQLSARNGSLATFLSGGQYPYTVSTINGPTVLFKDYGVRLNITPQVDRTGVIRAKIDSEVSTIDGSVTTPSGPGLLTRKTTTEFNVHSGDTIVLSGLLSRETSTNIDKVPFLGDLPILGALFRSTRFQNRETELVVFVTPTVVDSRTPGLVDRVDRTTDRLQKNLGKQPYLTDPIQPERDPAKVKSPQPVSSMEGAASMVVKPVVEASEAKTQPEQQQPAAALTLIPPSYKPAPTKTDTTKTSGMLQVALNGLPVRAEPKSNSQILLQLAYGSIVQIGQKRIASSDGERYWRSVVLGEIKGWVSERWLKPVETISDNIANNDYLIRQDQQGNLLGTNNSAGIASITAVSASGDVIAGQNYRVKPNYLALRVSPDINAPVIEHLRKGVTVHALSMPPSGYWRAVQVEDKRGWVASQWLVSAE